MHPQPPETTVTHEGRTAERIALNDMRFREANAVLRDRAALLGVRGPLPFICECAREECTEIVQLWSDEYDAVRSQPEWFLNAVGHQDAAGPFGVVVDGNERYVVVQKVGRAGEVVREES